MYLTHFGLKQPPFQNLPDTHYFYRGCKRGPILEAIMYAICSGAGITKVIGEVGTGKTVLCHKLVEMLPSDIEVIFIANPSLSPDHILHYIAHEIGYQNVHSLSKFEAMQMIMAFLLEQYKNGRQVVILIEESQVMPIETLEEIRLLSNLETTQAKLLQIVLFGQPELDIKLSQREIRQLTERISYNIYLPTFTHNDVFDYLNFRLRMSGYQGENVFSQRHSKKICQHSSGLIRRINNISDKMLLSAYTHGRRKLKNEDLHFALNECSFMKQKPIKSLLLKKSYAQV